MNTDETYIPEDTQRDLAAGVLRQAERILQSCHKAKCKRARQLYADAYNWVALADHSSFFSFIQVCRLLERVPDELRRELVGESAWDLIYKWIGRVSRRVTDFRCVVTRRLAIETRSHAEAVSF